MKRLLALLLAALLLMSGCAGEKKPDSSTVPQESTAATAPSEDVEVTVPTEITEATVPSEPPASELPDYGLYQPDSEIEIDTDGALRAYPLGDMGCYAAAKMGAGLLLFCGEDTTDLILVTEDEWHTADLGQLWIDPESCAFTILQDGLCYYDETENCLVFLDGQLRETERVRLGDDVQGYPVLSADRSLIYYCTANAIRMLEISSGISRLLREMAYGWQELVGSHMDGRILECLVLNGEQCGSLYLSAETGESLYHSDHVPVLDTDGTAYFAQYQDGSVWRLLYCPQETAEVQCLVPAWEGDCVVPILEMNGVVIYGCDERGVTLTHYNLEQGTCNSRVELRGSTYVWNILADPANDRVWFLGETAQREVTLYCWDLERSPSGDKTVRLTPLYSAENPDTDGLAACQAMADEIGGRHGVKILLWEQGAAIHPSDYTFKPEYLTQAYLRDLPILDQILARFPAGLLRMVAESSDNDILTISLVRGAYGSSEWGSLTTADGVQFWADGNAYLTLALGDDLEQTFYHELFHVIDTRVFSESNAYDDWDSLNPEGFEYDLDYVSNQYREDWQYLDDGDRAFIDMYSMSFPKEDRARIMEYAMMEDCGYLFASETMQAKLRKLCQGIREAFGLESCTAPLPWEQYLKEA